MRSIHSGSSLRALLIAGLALFNASTFASIRSATNADGLGSELFMMAVAQDASGNSLQSYTLDMGVLMDPFFAVANDDAGYQRFWIIDPALDAAWSQFVTAAVGENVRWAVLGVDNSGSNLPGGKRLYTTVTQGQESRLYAPGGGAVTNGNLSTFALQTPADFIDPVNRTGSHNVPDDATNQLASSWALNGSSYNTPQDGAAFVGELLNSFDNKTSVSYGITNELGKSSWFYYVTRSSTSNIAVVRLDEFDNLGADGYFGFARETGTSRYLLSYTLPAFVSARETALGITASNSFAHLAGVLSLSSVAGKGDSVLSLTEGFLRGLATTSKTSAAVSMHALADLGEVSTVNAAIAVSPVPEPSSWALMGAGAALLAGLRCRRARA